MKAPASVASNIAVVRSLAVTLPYYRDRNADRLASDRTCPKSTGTEMLVTREPWIDLPRNLPNLGANS